MSQRFFAVTFLGLLLTGCGTSNESAGAGGLGKKTGLRWYTTCGDPVCNDEPAPPSTCGSHKAGDACTRTGEMCEPGLGCGALLVCDDEDPTSEGCPVSLRAMKANIQYLGEAAHKQLADKLLAVRLATYRYRAEPAAERLGFIIDDQPGQYAVLPRGDRVDLYGYTSMAVATIQLQAQKIAELEARLDRLERLSASHGQR